MARKRLVASGIPLILLVIILLAGLLPPSVSLASVSISKARARATELRAQLATLSGQMGVLAARYDATAQRLSGVDAQVSANELQLQKTGHDLDLARQTLAEQAVAMYEAPTTGFLEVSLTATSLNDLISGAKMWDEVFRQGEMTLASITHLKGQIRQRGDALAADRAQVHVLLGQIAQQRTQITAAVQQARTLLAGAQARVKTILKQMEAKRAAARAASTGGGPVVAAAGDYTPSSWARALLGFLGMPRTSSNVTAITAWELAEGGHWYNSAHYNPLNTTMPEPGATSMNSVGVKAYTSWAQGFTATIATLRNGLYGAILAALTRGNDAMAVAQAVAASPWGTGPFTP